MNLALSSFYIEAIKFYFSSKKGKKNITIKWISRNFISRNKIDLQDDYI